MEWRFRRVENGPLGTKPAVSRHDAAAYNNLPSEGKRKNRSILRTAREIKTTRASYRSPSRIRPFSSNIKPCGSLERRGPGQ